nr:carbohydrate porin [uncultured Rhodopila sp.]
MLTWYRASVPGKTLGQAIMVGALTLAASLPARAQGTGVQPGEPGSENQNELNQPLVATAPPPFQDTNLLGDLGGERTKLLNKGIDIEVGAMSEFGANTSGLKTGAGAANQVTFSLDIDWERLANIPGFSTHFVVVNRSGSNISRNYGDNLTQSAEVYGAGFGVGVHFVYLYGQETLFNDRLNIAIGRLPVATDFAASPLYCLPIALLNCGTPRALTNNASFTSWPQSTWGGRVRVRPTPETYIQFGAYESEPFPGGGRTGWSWSTVNATGTILPVEIAWEPVLGPNHLTGHYKLGFAYDTSDFNSLSQNVNGAPLLVSTEMPALVSGRTQFWATADQMLIRQGSGENAGLTLIGTYGHSSSDVSATWQTAYLGMLEQGFWRSRPTDQIMLSGAWWGISNQLGSLQQQQAAIGLPLANGAAHPQSNEYAIELDYIAKVYRGITFEPGVQYFIHPNADAKLPNAFVFAGRLNLKF